MAEELNEESASELTPEEQAELLDAQAAEWTAEKEAIEKAAGGEETISGEGAEGEDASLEEAKLAKFAEEFPELADDYIAMKEAVQLKAEADAKAAQEAKSGDGATLSEDDQALDDQYQYELAKSATESEEAALTAQYNQYAGIYHGFTQQMQNAITAYVEANRGEEMTAAQINALAVEARNDPGYLSLQAQAEPHRKAALDLLRTDGDQATGKLADARLKKTFFETANKVIPLIPEAKKFPSFYGHLVLSGKIDMRAAISVQRKALQGAIREAMAGRPSGAPPEKGKIAEEKIRKLMKLRGFKSAKGRQGAPSANGKDKAGRPVGVVAAALDPKNLM